MNAATPPDLSVVIPTRNRPDKLIRCLHGLAKQTLDSKRFEVIVVDNGSAGEAPAANRRLVEEAPFRCELVSETHPGPAAARNRGIDSAKARRLLFLGDDILASPVLLSEHLEAAARQPDKAILGFTDWSPNLRITPLMSFLAPDRGPQFCYEKIRDPEDCGYAFFYTSNISLERRWFELERFDERFPYACLEDADLGYRLQKHGLKIALHRPALAWHDHAVRFHDFLERMRQMGESNVLFYEKYPELHDDPNVIPSEGYRSLDTPGRRLKMAAAALAIDAADRWGIAFSDATYQRVLEFHYVRAFFEALDRKTINEKRTTDNGQ